jgi:sugar/nucleoside kinase (ribokinase family)
MVMVEPDGERRFVHYLGANARLTLDDVDLAWLPELRILHVAGSLVLPGLEGEPTARLLQGARADGVTTFLDTVWDDTGQWMELRGAALPYVDYFVPSLLEVQELTGLQAPEEVAQALLAQGVGTVVLKMGADGCLVVAQDGSELRAAAYQVEAVDATGAGDAFAAGFIAGVWHGWSLEKTARFANAVGALCVTGLGAADGVRSLDETFAFMATTLTF